MMIITRYERLKQSVHMRLSEWILSSIMFGLGLMFGLPEKSMDSPLLMQMTYTMTENAWAVVCGVLGFLRLIVLGINGAWKKQGHARTILSILHLVVWSQIAIVFLNYHVASPGDIIFPIFVCSELFLIFRAAKEAGVTDGDPENGKT